MWWGVCKMNYFFLRQSIPNLIAQIPIIKGTRIIKILRDIPAILKTKLTELSQRGFSSEKSIVANRKLTPKIQNENKIAHNPQTKLETLIKNKQKSYIKT